MRRSNLVQMLLVGAILAAVMLAITLSLHWFPSDAAKQAKPIDTLYKVLLIVSVPIFAGVCTVVGFAVWKFRRRPGDELKDGPSIHGNTKLEIIWTAAPAILLVSLSTYAYAVLHHIEKGHKDEMTVNVTGQQFAWRFDYPQAGPKVSSDELYVPVSKPIVFRVHALDVLHDFWVPNFRMKIDAVPGITTTIRVTPTKVGDFPVVCAELCGAGHSVMRSTVHVLSAGAFQAWLARKKGGGAAAGGGGSTGATATAPAPTAGGASGSGDATAGKAIFTGAAGCGGCHKLADAGTSGATGPDLGQALKTFTPARIMESIVKPNAEIAKGYPANVMPQNFGQTLSPKQLKDLVAYLVKATR